FPGRMSSRPTARKRRERRSPHGAGPFSVPHMKWNWQHKNWPQFSYEQNKFLEYERQFLEQTGIQFGSIKHINERDKNTLKIDLISNEAYKTSEIEGELLRRDSLQSSIRKQFGLQTDRRKVSPAEHGIAEMMVDLFNSYNKDLTHESLFIWHEMLTNGRRDLKDIGTYRTHAEPMQIISGPYQRTIIHFEAPPSKSVRQEMQKFINWFNKTAKHKGLALPTLIRAGIAHLYFESIHPFEDGNGRIGRALSEKALSQDLGRPTLIAISHTIESKKKDYYAALHENSKSLEITAWLEYFCKMILQAQKHTQSMIDFLIEKAKFYQKYANQLNPRQEKVISRIFQEGINGFEGGLSAKNYLSITATTRATATRDLQNLVEKGVFLRVGELKSTRYYLNIDHESVLIK
ncbi:MAG: Fic family protein, partial [Bacteroidota bacterium]